MRLALKLFRGEPAISGFDWNFSAIHSSSAAFSTEVGSVLHGILLPLQPDHGEVTRGRVIYQQLCRPIQTRFPFGSRPEALNLATDIYSPDHSTIGTISHLDVLYVLVGTGFQVLFHSPPGVLFTFPSQYYSLSVIR